MVFGDYLICVCRLCQFVRAESHNSPDPSSKFRSVNILLLYVVLLRLETVAAAEDLEAFGRPADAERLLHRLWQPQARRLRKQDRQQPSQYSDNAEDYLIIDQLHDFRSSVIICKINCEFIHLSTYQWKWLPIARQC